VPGGQPVIVVALLSSLLMSERWGEGGGGEVGWEVNEERWEILKLDAFWLESGLYMSNISESRPQLD
jgi:hypothetical protein